DSQGLDTLRRAHAFCQNLPVVVLTGLRDEASGVEAVREGAQDYLIKGQLDGPLLVRALRYAIERKRSEEALYKAEEQLRQAQKMEVVGRLAAGVAHDINNMMTVVNGFSDLLLQSCPAEDRERRDLIEEIGRAGHRATAVSRQLLAFCRRQML